MKTILPTSIALTAFASAVLAGHPASATDDMVVISATDAAFARGAIVDGRQPIALAAGHSVTLIGADGAVVTLTGPFDQSPVSVVNRTQPGDPGLVVALGALLTDHENSTATLGVIRSAVDTAEIGPLPNPWFVSVERSGTRCIRPDMVTFWREDAEEPVAVNIAALRTGRSADLDWPAGAAQLTINGASFRDGQTYLLSLEEHEVALTMHVLPVDISGVAEQAGWMAQAGCGAQALALLDSVQ